MHLSKTIHSTKQLMLKTPYVILLLVLINSTTGYTQDKLATIDSLITKLYLEQGFDGNVLIADKGHVIYEKSFGYANVKGKIPLTANSIFNLASVSKVFTSVAIMKLAELGKINLTDDLQQYFPDLPYEHITIYHLLTHTSGLEDFMADPVRNGLTSSPSNGDIEKTYGIVHLPLKFPPGSNWSYSNTNFLLLALIIEKASGMSYPEFIKQYIFHVAKMEHSFVLLKNAAPKLRNLVADIYYYPDFLTAHPVIVDSIPMAKMQYALIENSYGDGGIFSTTADLFRFQQALLQGKILSVKSQQIMYSPVMLPNGKTYQAGNANPDYNSNYGLGWIVAKDSTTGKIAWHSGADPGLLTFFMQNITKDQCVVVLNNNWYRGTYHLGGTLMNILNNKPLQLMAPSLARKIGQEYAIYGADSAIRLLGVLKKGKDYHIGFLEMNGLGYDLLGRNDTKTAIEIFKVNTEQYPNSGDVWDSLAEAYYKAGDRETAIKDYEKSIALDPNNENGKKMLRKIKDEVSGPQDSNPH
jgi:CubicO group peptidase (beta-lactamase class C family)